MSMSVFPVAYPGQEDVECWLVFYFVDRDDALTKEEIKEAMDDPEDPLRIVGENLTLVDAAILVDKLQRADPETRYYVMPVRLKKPS
jgi:hypothetical protein